MLFLYTCLCQSANSYLHNCMLQSAKLRKHPAIFGRACACQPEIAISMICERLNWLRVSTWFDLSRKTYGESSQHCKLRSTTKFRNKHGYNPHGSPLGTRQ